MCAKFPLEIFNPVVVGTRQSFQFFRQNTWYLENNRDLSKFLYGVSHYLISILKLLKISQYNPGKPREPS